MSRKLSHSRRPTPVLPFDVRYALKYREAVVSPQDVLALDASFPELCLYGVSKLLHADRKLERMRNVLNAFLWETPASFTNVTRKALNDVTITCSMSKLAEHSRKIDGIDAEYRSAGIAHRGRMVYLLAHSTLAGLKPFDEARGESFGVLYEPLTDDEVWQSFIIDPADHVVSGPRDPQQGPCMGVILDDIERTSATRSNVETAFPGAEFAPLARINKL